MPRRSFGVYRLVGEPLGIRGHIRPGETVALRFSESHYMFQGVSMGVSVPRSDRVYVTKQIDLPTQDRQRAARVTEMPLAVDETFKIWGPVGDLSIQVEVLSGELAILHSNQTLAISRVGGFHFKARYAFATRAAGSAVQLSGGLADGESIRLGIRRDRKSVNDMIVISAAPRSVNIGRDLGTLGELRV